MQLPLSQKASNMYALCETMPKQHQRSAAGERLASRLSLKCERSWMHHGDPHILQTGQCLFPSSLRQLQRCLCRSNKVVTHPLGQLHLQVGSCDFYVWPLNTNRSFWTSDPYGIWCLIRRKGYEHFALVYARISSFGLCNSAFCFKSPMSIVLAWVFSCHIMRCVCWGRT